MAVIFDLDQTLIDSSAAEPYRKARNWPRVYGMIPHLSPYEGIPSLIKLLNSNQIPTAIVTSSPKSYCDKVVSHWKWEVSTTVGYHCATYQKPHPAPILLAIQKLGMTPSKDIISIGDHSKDIKASKAAGIYTIGCTWGIIDKDELVASEPDQIANTIDELSMILVKRLNLKN